MTRTDKLTYSLPNKTKIPMVFLWDGFSGNDLSQM